MTTSSIVATGSAGAARSSARACNLAISSAEAVSVGGGGAVPTLRDENDEAPAREGGVENPAADSIPAARTSSVETCLMFRKMMEEFRCKVCDTRSELPMVMEDRQVEEGGRKRRQTSHTKTRTNHRGKFLVL